MSPEIPGSDRFLADSMLEKLARLLRLRGHDVHSDPGASTATLVERADREERVFLTRNRRLAHHALLPRRSVRVRAQNPLEQVRELEEAGRLPLAAPFTRCASCNRELHPIPPEAARGRVPPRVHASHRRFDACPRCGKVYWRGSHVRRTCRRLGVRDVSECEAP